MCDIDASQVTDEALSKKKGKAIPVGHGLFKKDDKSSKDDVEEADED